MKEKKIHPEISASPEMKDIDDEPEGTPAWNSDLELEYLVGFDKPIFKDDKRNEGKGQRGSKQVRLE